jgi:CheY-like chemotaxis protein
MQAHSDGAAGPHSPRRAATKILVIEDNIVVRQVVADALVSAGYSPVLASNGREGLDLFMQEGPALVITDILMPEVEGIETILRLRRLQPDLKIIAVSGGERDYLGMAAKLGACAALAKPFRPAELLGIVAECLGE